MRASERRGSILVEVLIAAAIASVLYGVVSMMFCGGMRRGHEVLALVGDLASLNVARAALHADQAAAIGDCAALEVEPGRLALQVPCALVADGTIALAHVEYRLERARGSLWLSRQAQRIAGPLAAGRFEQFSGLAGHRVIRAVLETPGARGGRPTVLAVQAALRVDPALPCLLPRWEGRR
jgi:hypothetical protein